MQIVNFFRRFLFINHMIHKLRSFGVAAFQTRNTVRSFRGSPCGLCYFLPLFQNRLRITIPNWICNFIHCKSPSAFYFLVGAFFFAIIVAAVGSPRRSARTRSGRRRSLREFAAMECTYRGHGAPIYGRGAADDRCGFNVVKFVQALLAGELSMTATIPRTVPM